MALGDSGHGKGANEKEVLRCGTYGQRLKMALTPTGRLMITITLECLSLVLGISAQATDVSDRNVVIRLGSYRFTFCSS